MDTRIRALAFSIHGSIDCAMNSLVWKDHPDAIEDLRNAQDILDVILDLVGDKDDPDELDFDY